MKKYLFIIVLLFSIVGLVFVFQPDLNTIRADSGWDSNYSSSSSSSNSSSRSDRGSSDGSMEDYLSTFRLTEVVIFEIIMFFAYIIILILTLKNTKLAIIVSLIRTGIMLPLEIFLNSNFIILSVFSLIPISLIVAFKYGGQSSGPEKPADYFVECPDEDLISIGITNRNEFEITLYNIFVGIQNAWMNFDYDALSKLCSNELYNSYKSDLEILKIKNGQNIMSDFTLHELIINSVEKNNDDIIIKTYLNVIFKDYVIDTKTNNVIRGQKYQPLNNKYRLEFTKKINVVSNCPSCGSKLEDIKDNKCPYCNSIIINNNNNYVLSHKEIINNKEKTK